MSGLTKPLLISVPVGNNPARVRFLIYLKGLEQEIDIATPAHFGGIASDRYRALNPQGKIPVLILPDGTAFFEARIISGYISERWQSVGPSLLAPSLEQRTLAALINQIHDLYIASPNSSDPRVTATQGCMYKGVDVIDGPSRSAKVQEIAKQLDVLERLVVTPYCVGDTLTEADLALYPTFHFFHFILPRVFEWDSHVLRTRPKLGRWFAKMEELPAAQRIKAEILPALEGWEANGKFSAIIEQVKACPNLPWGDPSSIAIRNDFFEDG
mmetsp:Transcript_46112/g.76214  ORF Transcript_46112/g.76214 Transcript_46112/m.76214 type:complete len:270 (-) Transcript_46112:351-1160(-)